VIRRFRVGWNLRSWAILLDISFMGDLFVLTVGPFYIERCDCCD
jgi:hypothetical protein